MRRRFTKASEFDPPSKPMKTKQEKTTKRYARVTLADARAEFGCMGLTLLAEGYVNVNTPLQYRCNVCGFTPPADRGLRLNDLRRKNIGCRACAFRKRGAERAHSIEYVRSALSAVGIILLSKSYTSVEQDLEVQCQVCGHPWQATFHDLNPEGAAPTGCPPCALKRRSDSRRYTTEQIRAELDKMGIDLLGEYRGAGKPLHVRHRSCGHPEPNKPWNTLQQGRGCGRCAKNARVTDEDYDAIARQFNGQLVRKAPTADADSDWICSIGHPFKRPYSTIKALQTFCNICSGSYAEILCRMLAESLFDAPFRRVRVKEMRSPKGKPLELDIFNANLRLAIEHNGPHHYEPVSNWGGETAFKAQQENDAIRRAYCREAGIVLIEIRQLGERTTLEQAKKQIRNALIAADRPVPPSFDTAELSTLAPRSETEAYWELIQQAAANIGLKVLPCVYEGADIPVPVRCEFGHVTPKTPRSILQGHKCDECNTLRLRKPVQLSDGRVFQSGTEAANALGVTKETINKAARNGRQVKGLRVHRINEEHFNQFSM